MRAIRVLTLLGVAALAATAQVPGCAVKRVVSKSSSYTVLPSDNGTLFKTSSASLSFTLPSTAPTASGPQWCVVIVNTTAGDAGSILPNGLTINGSSLNLPVAYGNPGFTIISDGSNYFTPNMPGSYVLCNSGTASSTNNTGSETNMAICKIPGGTLGANGRVEVTSLWVFTETSHTKTERIRFSTTSGDTSGGMLIEDVAAGTTNLSAIGTHNLWNSNSVSAQVSAPASLALSGVGGSTSTTTTGSVNTNSTTYINLGCFVGTGGTATCGLVGYTVRIYPAS